MGAVGILEMGHEPGQIAIGQQLGNPAVQDPLHLGTAPALAGNDEHKSRALTLLGREKPIKTPVRLIADTAMQIKIGFGIPLSGPQTAEIGPGQRSGARLMRLE